MRNPSYWISQLIIGLLFFAGFGFNKAQASSETVFTDFPYFNCFVSHPKNKISLVVEVKKRLYPKEKPELILSIKELGSWLGIVGVNKNRIHSVEKSNQPPAESDSLALIDKKVYFTGFAGKTLSWFKFSSLREEAFQALELDRITNKKRKIDILQLSVSVDGQKTYLEVLGCQSQQIFHEENQYQISWGGIIAEEIDRYVQN